MFFFFRKAMSRNERKVNGRSLAYVEAEMVWDQFVELVGIRSSRLSAFDARRVSCTGVLCLFSLVCDVQHLLRVS